MADERNAGICEGNACRGERQSRTSAASGVQVDGKKKTGPGTMRADGSPQTEHPGQPAAESPSRGAGYQRPPGLPEENIHMMDALINSSFRANPGLDPGGDPDSRC
jgi:hypothetical protein